MITFELSDDHPLIISLNKMLVWVRSSDIPKRPTGISNSDLSEEGLNATINGRVSHCYRSKFSNYDYDFSEVERYATDVYEDKTGITEYELMPVSKTYYPENGGYLNWHLDDNGDRLYSTWAYGYSFFRYRDPDTKKIITSLDKPNQWNFRIFTFDAKNPLWHCVYAKDVRVSIGYRFVHQ